MYCVSRITKYSKGIKSERFTRHFIKTSGLITRFPQGSGQGTKGSEISLITTTKKYEMFLKSNQKNEGSKEYSRIEKYTNVFKIIIFRFLKLTFFAKHTSHRQNKSITSNKYLV